VGNGNWPTADNEWRTRVERFTIEDLKRLMRECAGEDEQLNLDGEVLDRTFEDLGYDSLAVMEVTSRAERELKVSLPEDAIADVLTPRDYVSFVNKRLVGKAGER
jgi:minimal PKS acyl carrier protein